MNDAQKAAIRQQAISMTMGKTNEGKVDENISPFVGKEAQVDGGSPAPINTIKEVKVSSDSICALIHSACKERLSDILSTYKNSSAVFESCKSVFSEYDVLSENDKAKYKRYAVELLALFNGGSQTESKDVDLVDLVGDVMSKKNKRLAENKNIGKDAASEHFDKDILGGLLKGIQ